MLIPASVSLEADVSLGSGRVTRVLDQLIEERGHPESVRSDNGPEFCSRQMLGWAEEQKISLSPYPTRQTNAKWACRKLPWAPA